MKDLRNSVTSANQYRPVQGEPLCGIFQISATPRTDRLLLSPPFVYLAFHLLFPPTETRGRHPGEGRERCTEPAGAQVSGELLLYFPSSPKFGMRKLQHVRGESSQEKNVKTRRKNTKNICRIFFTRQPRDLSASRSSWSSS